MMHERLYGQEKPAVGTFISSSDTVILDSVMSLGLDFNILDTEHGCFNDESLLNAINITKKNSAFPFVRITSPTRREIMHALDLGAEGLIVPYVRSMDEIMQVIDYAFYPPKGNRGVANTAGNNYLLKAQPLSKTLADINDNLIILPQCETVECIEILDDILACPEISGIFVGPFDLSSAMGIPGEFENKEFLAQLKLIVEKCRKYNKLAYTYSGFALLDHFKKFGFHGYAVGNTIEAVQRSYQSLL